MAIGVAAAIAVIDLVAIADIPAIGRAKPPNGVLHEPRKIAGIFGVEGPSIDLTRDGPYELSTATGGVAADAVAVHLAASLQDARTVQEIMDESIDGDHAATRLEPKRSALGRAD